MDKTKISLPLAQQLPILVQICTFVPFFEETG